MNLPPSSRLHPDRRCRIHFSGRACAWLLHILARAVTITFARLLLSATVIAVIPGAASAPTAAAQAPASRKLIPVEQYTLPNGMKVIFHVDRSDPVVAVALNAHVGSSREIAGRTGFAHLFEHLF